LITINYNKGAFKVHLSLKEVIEIIKIRETLECLSLEMVNDIDLKLLENLYESIPDINSFKGPEDISKYPEFDQQFHEKMIQMGKSQWLYRLIKNQDCVFHMLRFIALQDIQRIKRSIEEHMKIYHALRINDIPLAIRYTHDNFRSSIQTMELKSSNHPGLFR
jgi:DNA-binding GntR family transcriptional regulator